MVDFERKEQYNIHDFRRIITILRSPEGCPWDREQTHESIRRNFIEEAYEAVEAIEENDREHLCEELGDVLMQVIFHADIACDAGRFDLDQVCDWAVKKLIRRHPHIFSGASLSSAGEVLENWEHIKRAEKKQTTVTASLNSVARNLPSLWRAEKIQKKAAKAHPSYDKAENLTHRLSRLTDALSTGSGIEDAIGDLIFSAVNAARAAGVDPENAVNRACDRFIAQFEDSETGNA